MKKINLPCDVCITRYYRTYVDVSDDATDAEIREAVVKQILEDQDLVLCADPDIDIEEDDITMVSPDWDGAEPVEEDEPEANSRRIVRCNRCGEWLGWEDELVVKDDVEHCPHCGASDALMDVDSGCNFSKKDLENLWSMFGDIPMDPETERMEGPFLGFESGTAREDIWHWFDHLYPGGVHALIYSLYPSIVPPIPE